MSQAIPIGQRRLYVPALLTAAAAVFLAMALICLSPQDDLGACRLAQIVSMRYGGVLYPDPQTGVMSPWTYGPAAALLYLPVSFLKDPSSEILAAAAVNGCVVLICALWLHLKLATRQHRIFGLLAFLVFLWIVVSRDDIVQTTLAISPDGPMLAAITLAVALLHKSRGMFQLVLAALFQVLACLCNAATLPTLLVIPAYLLLGGEESAQRRRALGIYLVSLLLFAIVIGGAMTVGFGALNMWHFMVALPLAQRIGAHPVVQIRDACLMLIQSVIPTVGLLVGAALLGRFFKSPQSVEFRRHWLDENPWVMLPAYALVMVPAAVFGYATQGHRLEAFGAVDYFLAATTTLLLILAYQQVSFTSLIRPADARFLLVVAACVYSVWQASAVLLKWHRPVDLYQTISARYQNKQQTAYVFAMLHPGQVFFPCNTLSSLLAERRIYHCEWGFCLRYRANPDSKVDLAQVQEYLPPQERFIAFPQPHESEQIRQLFLHATRTVDIQGLPRFIAYMEPEAPEPSVGATTKP